MIPPPPSAMPPPPIDREALTRQRRRIRQKRWIRAAFLSAILVASVASAWVLSRGELPSRSDWAFTMTRVDGLQAQGFDGAGQTVCLVDTGLDAAHPDFSGLRILAWRDYVRNGTAPYDDDGHGTAMAGLIAGQAALRGVAPGVSLLIAKALDSQGRGTSAGLAAAIDFCLDPHGDGTFVDEASVISLSLGAATNLTVGTDVTAAVGRALARGVVVVASAGNDGMNDDGDVQNPASLPEVLAVGSVDSFGAVAAFSSIGADAGRSDPNRKPEVVAPGVDLLSTARGGGYRLVSGTSASAGFLSGIIALLLQGHPRLSRSGTNATILELKGALMVTARPMAAQQVPHDPHYGYGIVDATAAAAVIP